MLKDNKVLIKRFFELLLVLQCLSVNYDKRVNELLSEI